MSAIIGLDHGLAEAATRLGGTSGGRDAWVYFFADVLPVLLGSALVYLFVTGPTLAQVRRNREVVIVALLSMLLAIGVRSLIANAVSRPRPLQALHIHHLASHFSGSGVYSFPSGHASVLFAGVGAVFFMRRHNRLGAVLLVMAAIVISARVVAGYHYPSDVLGGAVLGLGIGWLVSWQSRYVERQLR